MASRKPAVISALAFLMAFGVLFSGDPSDDRYAAGEVVVREALESGDPSHPRWVELSELVVAGLEANEAGALYYAAFLYNYGRAGFPVDPAKADSLELEAAKLRYVPAMRARAIRADNGFPPAERRDVSEAAFWFRELAKEGSASAACWLMEALAQGEFDFRPGDAELEERRALGQTCKAP